MNNPFFSLTCFDGDKKIKTAGAAGADYIVDIKIDGNRLFATLTAKKTLRLFKAELDFNYHYPCGCSVFGNGYQSWTTTKEYKKTDRMQDITPIAALDSLNKLAGISSDCRFVDTPSEKGLFISHCYTYIRNGENMYLIGSLSEKQGFTVFYLNMNRNILTASKDLEGVTLQPGDSYTLFELADFSGGYDEVFDGYFTAMGLKEPRIKHLSGYTSWYNYFQKIDEDIILRDLNALDDCRDSVSIFQIDDGYESFVGDWCDMRCDRFPNGMGYIADEIHKKGYMAGIWLAPFNVQIKSRTYRQHPDWVIKDDNGRPLLGCAGWGGAYTLDIYNPDAREYIKGFFNTVLNKWGYDMVKLDFLYSQCMYPRGNKSRGEIMCEAMEFLRECCGDKLVLGCGVPLGAAFGYVDACRISCDVDLKYGGKFYNYLHVNNEIPSAQNAITNSVFRRHLDGRAFCNDPDVFFLRYTNLDFSLEQKELLGLVNHIFGNVLFVSDDAGEYTSYEKELIKKFFVKSDFKVLSAECSTGDLFEIKLQKGDKTAALRFNLRTGNSNAKEIIAMLD